MQTGKKFEGTVINPFSEDFEKHWVMWKTYKEQDHRFTYKSNMSEQAGLNELVDLSDGDEQEAIRIINRSMAQGWKGLFRIHKSKKDVKPKPESTGKAESGAKTISIDKIKDLHASRYGNTGEAGNSQTAK